MFVNGQKRQRVLLVHNYYQIPGGEDTVVANEARMLKEHGHEVFFYNRNNSELKEMSLIRKLFLPFTTVFNPRTYREIRRSIVEHDIDVVHVHNTLNLISPAVYYAALSCKVPVVQTIHNFRLICPGATLYRDGHVCEECLTHGLRCAIGHGCYRGSRLQTLICVISTMLHRMTGIYGKIHYICLTEFNKEKLLKMKQISEAQVSVKPNFVSDSEVFVAAAQRKDQIVFVGRLEKLKGVDKLLEAWKQMGDEAPRLIMCGSGPMEQWCRDFIRENQIESVEMRGFVPNDRVRKLVAESKALILPTQCYEGFPMSIAEAFSVGTPVLCSDLGNAGSIVTEGVSGCKFVHDDPMDICRAVQRLYSTESWMDSVKQEYAAKYLLSQNYEMLIRIYEGAKLS